MIEAATLAAADTVVAAIVGAAGLAPTLAAARAGKRILLANKEALVIGGAAFMAAVDEGGADDLAGRQRAQRDLPVPARRLRARPARLPGCGASCSPPRADPSGDALVEALAAVTPEEACAHPNWVMGRKISVDSATMMNKGLEVIEAHWLFGVPRAAIEVVIHPQSVIHSLVEYVDGSVLAQLVAARHAHADRPGARVSRPHRRRRRDARARAPGSAHVRAAGPRPLSLPRACL